MDELAQVGRTLPILKRVGMYAWSGPTTIRMIRTKWKNPRVDEKSFLTLYDTPFLERAKKEFGLTDLWVTYSWGFGDDTEKEQHSFIREKLPAVRTLGIRTHAYVQGFNVVTSEHAEKSFFARTAWGKKIPYSRGRHLLCPTNPETRAFLDGRVRNAARENVDGVFVDNIFFGALPFFVSLDFMSTLGCHCPHCQSAFKEIYGYALPTRPDSEATLRDVVAFRVRTVTEALSSLSRIAREHGKQFGVNLFDPRINTPELYFGYSLEALQPHLDYYLFENHAIETKGASVDNSHLRSLPEQKTTFIVSYRHGIGMDSMYDRETLRSIFDDAREVGHAPCIKASEYVTDGVWHAFDFDRMPESLPQSERPAEMRTPRALRRSRMYERLFVRLTDRFIVHIVALVARFAPLQHLFERSGLLTRILRTPRYYKLPFSIS